MGGLAKGLAVLELFGPECKAVTITEAAEATDVSRAAARRCLLTLSELGYLAHDGRRFHPTPRLLRLGRAYTDAASLPQLAQPYLAETRDRLGESISLAVLHGDEAMFVARAEATRIVTTGVRVGVSLPAYLSATGHVLLSGLDDAQLDAYLAGIEPRPRTPRTPVDVDEIRARVLRVRETGIAHTDEELELGLRSLAVPVMDARGQVRAAMSVSAAAARITLDRMYGDYAGTLAEQARMLGSQL
jgi:IclR family pca regulon transcriptional regulator